MKYRGKEYIYMKTDGSEEDLPIAVSDSVKGLAEILGTTPNAISSMMSRGIGNYRKVEILKDD